MLFPVLLSGGVGSRLWPVSRKSYPKQYVDLFNNGGSLFCNTIGRFESANLAHSGWIIICGEADRFIVKDQLKFHNPNIKEIILEPFGRGTAPAIAVAAIQALKQHPDARLFIQTTDHVFEDEDYFSEIVETAIKSKEPFITFGIAPTRPETGYGYILSSPADEEVWKVESFIEKPDSKHAQTYFESENYFWNSGMFVIDAKQYLDELGKLQPEMLKLTSKACSHSIFDHGFNRLNSGFYERCPSGSIDQEIMEKLDCIGMIPFKSTWADVGSWDVVKKQFPLDKKNNVSSGRVVIQNSVNCFVRSEERLVALNGVKDLVVIETADAILVSESGKSQDVKHLVQMMQSENYPEAEEHTVKYSPWGSYKNLASSENFQINSLFVKVGASLSRRARLNRAEHWIIVSGEALIKSEERTFVVKTNESTFVPKGTFHQISNNSEEPLILIEVQSGKRLGDEDIVRQIELKT